MSIQDVVRALVEGADVPASDVAAALETMMTGEATPAQVGAFLAVLRARGETPEIIAACLGVTERHAEYVPVEGAIDIVGTGGDGTDTFNVSTAAAIVCAAAGVRVAKHGNRAASSKCGSADVLEALGAKLEISGAEAARIIEECGFCFLFAQRFHPAFRHVGPARREIGVRTIFNVLGPLSNPARVRVMVVGVGSKALGPIVAETFRLRGMDRVMVVHSADGMDEISPAGPTFAWLLEKGMVTEKELSPADFGLALAPASAVAGGDAATNAATMRAVLGGESGPVSDFVVMNAAAGLYVAGRAADLRAGAEQARALLRSGAALTTLDRYVALTREASGG